MSVQAQAVIQSAKATLAGKPGIAGVGFDGRNVIVYVANVDVRDTIPSMLAGYPVRIVVSGNVALL